MELGVKSEFNNPKPHLWALVRLLLAWQLSEYHFSFLTTFLE